MMVAETVEWRLAGWNWRATVVRTCYSYFEYRGIVGQFGTPCSCLILPHPPLECEKEIPCMRLLLVWSVCALWIGLCSLKY
jgi:hypothetical protein